jgi:uncharacterized protein
MILPAVGELGLGAFAGTDVGRKATHEDYTLKIVLDSSLGVLIEQQFADDGIRAQDVAELIVGASSQSKRFRHGGIDYAPLMRQIISSECDADRMDYLQRDSFYSGVNYGKFDADWLIDNVVPVEIGQSLHLGIRSRAVFSFEDFLLSRYHMFATVYLHHTPVIFEKMLARYFDAAHNEFRLSADVEKYVQVDDMDLWQTLRKSQNAWARRIVERRPYILLDEHTEGHGQKRGVDHAELVRRLASKKIDVIETKSRSVLSKYYSNTSGTLPPQVAEDAAHGKKAHIYVVDSNQATTPLEEYSQLYARYAQPALLHRVFVDPAQRTDARTVLSELVAEQNKTIKQH